MDNTQNIAVDFVQLARLALTGRPQDVQLMIHRAIKRYRDALPDMVETLTTLLRESPTRASPLRRQADVPLPVDGDTRLQLLRVEDEIRLDHEIIVAPSVETRLTQVVAERRNPEPLARAGLHPTRTLLFTGPPGVGKTMAARWIARELQRPLLILDLTAVMSSFLGRTGGNLRHVLDYAKQLDCILLLDEVDALAKRRDDRGEIGELKRLVTVLLQEIDDWPSSGLLIAATNHPELLDPAIWRRFEMAIDFHFPETAEIERLVQEMLKPHVDDAERWSKVLSLAFKGRSHSDIERELMRARRMAVTAQTSLGDQLRTLVRNDAALDHDERIALARALDQSGIMSQREASELTGVARDTIRNRSKSKPVRSKPKAAA